VKFIRRGMGQRGLEKSISCSPRRKSEQRVLFFVFKRLFKLGKMVPVCNASTLETEAGRLGAQDQPEIPL
jgi:hypothetical protein